MSKAADAVKTHARTFRNMHAKEHTMKGQYARIWENATLDAALTAKGIA